MYDCQPGTFNNGSGLHIILFDFAGQKQEIKISQILFSEAYSGPCQVYKKEMFDKGLDTPLFIYISQKSRKSMKFVSLSFFTQSTEKILLTGIEQKERKNDKKSGQH